jgi:hypothetical protein
MDKKCCNCVHKYESSNLCGLCINYSYWQHDKVEFIDGKEEVIEKQRAYLVVYNTGSGWSVYGYMFYDKVKAENDVMSWLSAMQIKDAEIKIIGFDFKTLIKKGG